jgi:type IV secretion system protein VirD4
VSGIHPILAKKARYYEDRRLQERILSPPPMQLKKKLPTARSDDWSSLLPVTVDPKAATGGPSADDLDNAGIRREPTLPEHEAITLEAPRLADPFAILMDEADDEPMQRNMLRQRMRSVARQASLDPGDDLGS